MDYKIGTKVLDGWEIVSELGRGAYGEVFEIHKNDFGIIAKAALKVIRIPHSSSDVRAVMSEGMDENSVTKYFEDVVQSIVKEIAIMAKLKSHPNIVSYENHKVIKKDGDIGWEILMQMELLTPLQEYQLKHVLVEEEVLRLAVELCDALSFCEKQGLIHRDIKPENIFVSDLGQFKLGDFGVARTAEKTMGGMSKKGTEGYMAPEVYLEKEYGPSVDIYSLGLVLYRLMNGNRLPFLPPAPRPISFSDREAAILKRMKGENMSFPANASEGFARIILKACAYRPKERYLSADEMLADLRRIYDMNMEVNNREDTYKAEEIIKEIAELERLDEGEKTVGAEPFISQKIDKKPKVGKEKKDRKFLVVVILCILAVVGAGIYTVVQKKDKLILSQDSTNTNIKTVVKFSTEEQMKLDNVAVVENTISKELSDGETVLNDEALEERWLEVYEKLYAELSDFAVELMDMRWEEVAEKIQKIVDSYETDSMALYTIEMRNDEAECTNLFFGVDEWYLLLIGYDSGMFSLMWGNTDEFLDIRNDVSDKNLKGLFKEITPVQDEIKFGNSLKNICVQSGIPDDMLEMMEKTNLYDSDKVHVETKFDDGQYVIDINNKVDNGIKLRFHNNELCMIQIYIKNDKT